jgi:hypothetical protein
MNCRLTLLPACPLLTGRGPPLPYVRFWPEADRPLHGKGKKKSDPLRTSGLALFDLLLP